MDSTSTSRFSVTSLLKKLVFNQSTKGRYLQPLWSRLHTLSIFGMNYGGGGLIESSGEGWVLANIIKPACRNNAAPVIFDVGANIGDYSLLVRQLMPAADIYSFEPSRSTYERLIEQISTESAAKPIRPFNVGFSDSEKTVELYSYSIEGSEVSLLSSIDQRLPTQVIEVKTARSEKIEVKTLDSFCEDQGVGHIDFLKLDVEGHELSVLRGAQKMLERRAINHIQFEFGPANIYSRTYFYDFWSLLSDQYDLFRIVPKGVVPITYYGEHREVFLTTNYLAVGKRTM
jgi:FkbM family methyltransferase